MSIAARGTKRVCPSCGARFYDLNRSPIVCPVCQSVYQLTPSGRRARAAAPVQAETEDDNEETETATEVEAEIISLEDAEETAEGDAAEEDEEEIADIGEDDPELPDDTDDEDSFLEDDEDDDDERVSGLLGGAGEDDEA